MTDLPYPEPRYRGETGEASARLRSADAAPEVSNPGGPDPHFHRSITESFYVLSGTIRLHDGNGWTDGRPGDFLYVPQGGVHGFRNESGEPASMLILFTPGAPREDYFERVRTTSAMTEEERAEFFLRHDTFWV